jgi:hypothetical protein
MPSNAMMVPPADAALQQVPQHIGSDFAAWCFKAPVSERSVVASRRLMAVKRAKGGSVLGEVKDWVWASITQLEPEQLRDGYRRYSCILMAQVPQCGTRLQAVNPALRAWALPIASVQPLPRLLDWDARSELPPIVMGMAELGLFIAHDFPHVWSRMLGDLRQPLRDTVGQLVADHMPLLKKITPVMRKRVLRCWAFAMNYRENE